MLPLKQGLKLIDALVTAFVKVMVYTVLPLKQGLKLFLYRDEVYNKDDVYTVLPLKQGLKKTRISLTYSHGLIHGILVHRRMPAEAGLTPLKK